jgi:hypothetical protein
MNLKEGGTGGFDHVNSCSEHQRASNKASALVQKALRENPEWRARKSQRMSERNKAGYIDGSRIPNPPNWTGRKHSESSRKKMSDSSKGKIDGAANPLYGKSWLYNPNTLKSKPVGPQEAVILLSEGWLRGRKMPKKGGG